VTHTDARTLTPLSYSDGEQYSRSARDANGRRQPTLAAASYDKHAQFLSWAAGAGYGSVMLRDPVNLPGSPWLCFDLLDLNRNGTPDTLALDIHPDGWLSDDERDEDADGLSNYDELHGRMLASYWSSCYSDEPQFQIAYAGTSAQDADGDGDGVLDGADDQDHDDVPNLMELSRIAASDFTSDWAQLSCNARAGAPKHGDADFGRVNPFNPCLPDTYSRTCPLYNNDKTGAPFYKDGDQWLALQ